MEKYISYPMFWSTDLIGEFWLRLCEIINTLEPRKRKGFVRSFCEDISAKKLFDEITGFEPTPFIDWPSQLDSDIKEYLELFKLLERMRSKKSELARKDAGLDGSFLGLLTTARNTYAHGYKKDHMCLIRLTPDEHEIWNKISDNVSKLLHDRGVPYWLKVFPEFLLFTYSFAYYLRNKLDETWNSVEQQEFSKKFLPVGNYQELIPHRFEDFIEEILYEMRRQFVSPTELYLESYQYMDRTITFFKFPKENISTLRHEIVKFTTDVQRNDTIEVSIRRRKRLQQKSHKIVTPTTGCTENMESNPGPPTRTRRRLERLYTPEDTLIKINIPNSCNESKRVEVIWTTDIESTFHEILEKLPCEIYAFTDKPRDKIGNVFTRYICECEYKIDRARLEWTCLSSKMQNSLSSLEFKLHASSSEIVKLNAVCNNVHVYSYLEEDFLRSIVHGERSFIFDDALPQLPDYYVERILHPTDAGIKVDEDVWMTNVTCDKNKGPFIISGAAGSGKSFLVSSIGRKLISEGYLVQFVTFHRAYEILSKCEHIDAKQVFQAIWDETTFHAKLAYDISTSDFTEIKIAVLLDGIDEIGIDQYEKADKILNQMLNHMRNIFIVICRRPSNEIVVKGTVYEVGRLIEKSQKILMKKYWKVETELQCYEHVFEEISNWCVKMYKGYNVELPIFCVLIAEKYVEFIPKYASANQAYGFVIYTTNEIYEMFFHSRLLKCISRYILRGEDSPTENTFIPKINKKSFLFESLKHVMDLTHQHNAVRNIMETLRLKNPFPTLLIQSSQIHKYGLVERDGTFIHASFMEFYEAKFVTECMSRNTFNHVPVEILKNILVLKTDQFSFQKADTVRFLNSMLTTVSAEFSSTFLRECGISYIHYFLLAAIKCGHMNLFTFVLNAFDEAGELSKILDTKYKDVVTNQIPKERCQNCLHKSVQVGHIAVIKYFVEFSLVDINQGEGTFKDTPMHKAVLITDLEKCAIIVKYLVENGADVLRQNKVRLTPVEYAKRKAKDDRKDFLISLISKQI